MSPLNTGLGMFSLFLVFVFGFFAPVALADFGMCQPGWEWANNTLQQNPCEVAGALDAQCEGFSAFVLGPLDQGSNYIAPQRNDTLGQKCNCNTVIFSLYMACTACQNVSTQSWSFWSQYCNQVFVTQYPDVIPVGTAVPHWAFLNYTAEDEFDPVTAKAAGGLPESVAPVPSTISLSSTSTDKGSPSPTTVGQGGNNQAKGSSNAGAIAGGVIGSLAAVVLIGVGAWLLIRKRAKARGALIYSRASSGAPMSELGHGISPLRPYNPSDPSTFPSQVGYGEGEQYTTLKGHYTGAAEL